MKAYYINRDADTERRELIEAELKLHNLNGSRFRALEPGKLPQIVTDTRIYFVTQGQQACLSSHLTLIKLIAESDSNERFSLILEDDCHLAPQIDFEQVIQQAPGDFGILQLSTSNAIHAKKLNDVRIGLGLQWHGWHSLYWGAHAYIITKAAAQAITLKLYPGVNIVLKGIHMPMYCVADHLIFKLVQTYTSCYPLACQRSMPSSIHPKDGTLDRETAEQFCLDLWSHPQGLAGGPHQAPRHPRN